MNSTVWLALAIMVLAVLVVLVLRFAVRWGLTGIGKRALDKQPGAIRLIRRDSYGWRNATAMEAFRQPLLARGFRVTGIYAIDTLPGLMLEFLVNVRDGFYAVIYEHLQVGVWLNLVSLYRDGTSITYTTAPDRGLEQRPGHPVVHQPGGRADVLYDWALAQRPQGEMKPLTAENLVTEFEKAYTEGLNWRKTIGISFKEVANVVKTHQSFVVPELEYLGEQDGPPEQEFKNSLSKMLMGWGNVQRAYLARVRHTKSVKEDAGLCLVSSSGDDPVLVNAIQQVFASQFGSGTHLDIIFLLEPEESQVSKVCRPFYRHARAITP